MMAVQRGHKEATWLPTMLSGYAATILATLFPASFALDNGLVRITASFCGLGGE